MTGTCGPGLNLLYWGIGNPGPDLYGEEWHFQFTPHDQHDWDACETPMLLNLKWKGRGSQSGGSSEPQRVLLRARSRNRRVPDGETIRARDMGEGTRVCPGLGAGSNWMTPSYDPQTGWFYFMYFEACHVFYLSPPCTSKVGPTEGHRFGDGRGQVGVQVLPPVVGGTMSVRVVVSPRHGVLGNSPGQSRKTDCNEAAC